MDTSVNEILTKLHFKIQDLNELPSSQLRNVFSNLSVKNILILCSVNQTFNTACNEESFWRLRVLDDYGIEKKYGDTWRETAIIMDKVNMINLNDKWIDNRTYREILDDSLQNGTDIIMRLLFKYLDPYVNHSEDDICHLHCELNDEKSMQEYANEVLKRDYTSDELDTIFRIKAKEIYVIYAAVYIYKGALFLPGELGGGLMCIITTGTALKSYEFLRKMIDPMLYVMQFSSFSIDKLRCLLSQ